MANADLLSLATIQMQPEEIFARQPGIPWLGVQLELEQIVMMMLDLGPLGGRGIAGHCWPETKALDSMHLPIILPHTNWKFGDYAKHLPCWQ